MTTFEPSLSFGVAYAVTVIVIAILILKISKVYGWALNPKILRRFMGTFANALLLAAVMLIFTPKQWALATTEIRLNVLVGIIFALFAMKLMWAGQVGEHHKEEQKT